MKQRLVLLAGAVLLLAVWALAARESLPAILPGPTTVADALVKLIGEGSFWKDTLLPSLARAAAGLVLAIVFGSALGLAGWRWPLVSALLTPMRLILLGMPAPILAILCILWFDGGSVTVVLTVAALLVPVMQIAVAEGMQAVDPQLQEVARIFRVPVLRRLHRVVLPAVWTALGPALRIAVANALRVTLLTELLAGSEGLGAAVQRAQSWLQTDRLFALIIVILVLIGMTDAMLSFVLPRRRSR